MRIAVSLPAIGAGRNHVERLASREISPSAPLRPHRVFACAVRRRALHDFPAKGILLASRMHLARMNAGRSPEHWDVGGQTRV
ncbi:MAG: hypothetical protein Q7S40_19710, partial [Opitutaceae bacterium]|nr:hypothetical protein [Opitutaceae bacterium]